MRPTVSGYFTGRCWRKHRERLEALPYECGRLRFVIQRVREEQPTWRFPASTCRRVVRAKIVYPFSRVVRAAVGREGLRSASRYEGKPSNPATTLSAFTRCDRGPVAVRVFWATRRIHPWFARGCRAGRPTGRAGGPFHPELDRIVPAWKFPSSVFIHGELRFTGSNGEGCVRAWRQVAALSRIDAVEGRTGILPVPTTRR